MKLASRKEISTFLKVFAPFSNTREIRIQKLLLLFSVCMYIKSYVKNKQAGQIFAAIYALKLAVNKTASSVYVLCACKFDNESVKGAPGAASSSLVRPMERRQIESRLVKFSLRAAAQSDTSLSAASALHNQILMHIAHHNWEKKETTGAAEEPFYSYRSMFAQS